MIGACCVFIALGLSTEKQLHQQEKIYGQSLANNAARNAIDAMFRNDLLQLQTLLQGVVQNPMVVSASVHSVENKILVQAGSNGLEAAQNLNSFEAAITLPDSVAGFVKVDTLSTPTTFFSSVFSFFIVVCLAWIGWILYRDQNIVLSDRTSPHTLTSSSADSSSVEEDTDEIEEEVEAPQANACLAICVKNADVLKQQLSGSAYREVIFKLEQTLLKISKIYGAIDCIPKHNRYIFRFFSDERSDALFQAICSGRVMLDLAGIIKRVPFDLSAQVADDETELHDVDMPFVGLAVTRGPDASELLTDKVQLIEISTEQQDRLLVSGFENHYEVLLQKQMAQFKQYS
jgi:hypothetical protein